MPLTARAGRRGQFYSGCVWALVMLWPNPSHAVWDVEAHGVVNAAASHVPGLVDWNGLAPGDAGYASGGLSTSTFGVHGFERLGLGLRARVSLEMRFNASTGDRLCATTACASEPFFNGAQSVALSHYAYGRLNVGWQSALARESVDFGHVWAGETVATDQCAGLLRWPCAPTTPGNPPVDCRSDRSCGVGRGYAVRYDSPSWGAWSISAQIGARPSPESYTLAITYAGGGTAVSIAHVQVARSMWVTPVAISQSIGRWRLYGIHSWGRLAGAGRQYDFIGATSGLGGGELRIGVQRYRTSPETGHSKAAVGWHVPLSPRVIAYVDAARIRLSGRPDSGWGRGVDLGLQARF